MVVVVILLEDRMKMAKNGIPKYIRMVKLNALIANAKYVFRIAQ